MTLRQKLQDIQRPFDVEAPDYDDLLAHIGDAKFVLIGEASHGTHDFYAMRAEITKALIQQKGFNAVAVEADWPDAYRVNTYVRHRSDDKTANQALGDFKRFPTWMWRNTVMIDFVDWLRNYNTAHEDVGFYGLDLYSLRRSIEEVINYLDKVDPQAAQRARHRYGCFDHYGDNPQQYGYAANYTIGADCEDDVVKQLLEMQRASIDYARRDGRIAEDAYFYAEQNARLAKNAEAYYRSMFKGRAESWNLRDTHMAETLDQLQQHLQQQTGQAKIVVWAHNSHLGDARATEMSRRGEHNLGQLARQMYGEKCYNIGFSTYTGTVTAASNWGAEAERKVVRVGLDDSYEKLFHTLDVPNFMLHFRASTPLDSTRIQRAIGVIYRPQTERLSHYFKANVSQQFNTMIHLDETKALEPLERNPIWDTGEKVPDTYPFGQ